MAGCDNVPLTSQITEFAADMAFVKTYVETDALTATTPQGRTRRTLAGVEAAAQTVISEATENLALAIAGTGWFNVGTFDAGFTYTARNQVGRDAAGVDWSYNGPLPFTVAAGTTPSEPTYTNRADSSRWTGLAAVNSSQVIAGQAANKFFATFDTVAEMVATVASGWVGRRVQWLGYYAASDGGSGWGIVKSGSYTPDGGSIIAVGPSLYIEQNLRGGKISVRKFGARGDGTGNDSPAFNSVISYIKSVATQNSGGCMHVPWGRYRCTDQINVYVPVAKGFRITNDGYNVTTLVWAGPANTVFITNEQPVPPSGGPYSFQYGFFMSDFTMDCEVPELAGSVAIHLEMLQNKSKVSDFSILQFETGLQVGLHAEMLKVSTAFIAYCTVGAYGQGDQSDCLTFRNVTFAYNRLRALKLSSPRPIIDSCHFNAGIISDADNYRDIQVGYSAIRAQDIGKSGYAIAGRGNDASRARFTNNSFEGLGNKAPILFQNFDTRVGFGNSITFRDNKFAIYNRPSVLEVVNPYTRVAFVNSQLTTDNFNIPLINDPNAASGVYAIDEPFIGKVWATAEQEMWRGYNDGDYDDINSLSISTQHSTAWLWDRSHAGAISVTLDRDGLGTTRISYDESLFVGESSARLYNNSCPAGFVYILLPVVSSDNTTPFNIEVRNGSGVLLYSSIGIIAGPQQTDIVFGFNNPSVQSVSIRILPKPEDNGVGYLDIAMPQIKHANGEIPAFAMRDTKSGLWFANRSSQVFELIPRVPYVDMLNYTNQALGAWYCGAVKKSTVSAAAVSGATTITVPSASTFTAVGEYISFQPQTISGVTRAHSASSSTGNKVQSISGDVITLVTGTPFAIDSGASVISYKMYRKTDATQL